MEKETDGILRLEDLTIQFPTRIGTAEVLNKLNLKLKKSGKLGLVGESGVGKSVAAWACLNIIKPPGEIVNGSVNYNNENLLKKSQTELEMLRGKEIGLIVPRGHSQLNPLLTIGDQLKNTYMAHNKGSMRQLKSEAEETAIKMLKAVGLPDHEKRMKSYPNELSGGMAQRAVIALALINRPKVLIADDPTAGLDVTIQAQIMELLNNLVTDFGTAVLIITHHLGLVAQHCEDVAIMYAGQIVESSDTMTFFESAKHPYSKSLLASVRGTGKRRNPDDKLKGRLPNPKSLPSGCYLHPRCNIACEICRTTEPQCVMISENHMVKCHFAKSEVK